MGTHTGVVLTTVALLPAAAVAVWFLARRAGGTPAAWRMSLAEVGIVYGTAPWVWMTMAPGATRGHVSLIPGRDLLTVATAGLPTLTVQVVGNLLVFAALASVTRILAFAAGCSILIETAQYVLRLDRVSSVDDVLLNAAGAGLAALASRRWWHSAAGSVPVDLDLFLGQEVRQRHGRAEPAPVVAAHQVLPGDSRVVPERRPRTETAMQAVGEGVGVPPEVAAGAVDRRSRTVDVGDEPGVEVLGGADGPVRLGGAATEGDGGPVVAELPVVAGPQVRPGRAAGAPLPHDPGRQRFPRVAADGDVDQDGA